MDSTASIDTKVLPDSLLWEELEASDAAVESA